MLLSRLQRRRCETKKIWEGRGFPMRRGLFWFFLFLGIWVFPALAQDQDSVPWSLGEIVVTATKSPHAQRDLPVETEVITKQQINQSNAETVSDLLRYLPGIFVRDENIPGITCWKATMRGLRFNDGYALVLVDGERVRGEGMGDSGIGINQIPPQMIEKIEVVKGPISSLYGSDAVVGVVNIITKSVPNKPIYGFEADYGSHSTNVEYMYWGTKQNKFGTLVQAAREESSMGAYGFRNTRDESFERSTLINKFGFDLRKNVKFDLKISLQQEDRKTIYLTQDTQVYQKHFKYRISPSLNIDLKDKGKLLLKGYYYDWRINKKEYGTVPSGYPEMNGDMSYRDLEFRYLRPVLKDNLLTFGSEFLQQKLDYTFSRKTFSSLSVYLQDELSLGALDFLFGARFEDHSEYGSEFCPKVSMMYSLSENTKIRASVGRAFKSPTIRQAFYTEPYPHSDYYYVSNPDLKAETSWGYSLGVEHYIGSLLLANITVFRNDITNMITRFYTYRDINGDGSLEKIRTFDNTDKAFTQGVETTLRIALLNTPQFSSYLYAGYTYLHTENRETDRPLDDLPRHNFVSQFKLNYKPLDLFFNLAFQYVSETEDINSYSVVDLKLIKNISSNISLSLEGNNIFDSDYGGDPDRWWGATWFVRMKMDF